jgi:hypothetical protein
MPRIFCVLQISRDGDGGRSNAFRYIVFPDGFAERSFVRLIFSNHSYRRHVGIGPAKTSCESIPVANRAGNKIGVPMLYAILAYHVETDVMSWTPQEDAALMTNLLNLHERFYEQKSLGPSARLGATKKARTLRGPGAGTVIDGPFAETKEQLLGFYVVDCASEDAAIAIARDLRRVNPTAVYEIRPVPLYLPGVPFPTTEAASDG